MWSDEELVAALLKGEEDWRVLELLRRFTRLRASLLEEICRTDALVAALPKCDGCRNPATKAEGRGGPRYCDEHGRALPGLPEIPDYPRAEPLRAILAARLAQ